MSDINIGKNASIYVVWRTDTPNVPDEEIESVRSKFASKYGVKRERVRVEVKNGKETGIGESFNSENINSVHDPKYHQELFKMYLKEKGGDYDIDEIIKIDSQINSLIDYDSYEKGLKYTLKWIKWSNILSYGKENHFDFTKLTGIVNVTGKPANQSGKTTFADDIIHILLFGHTNKERASKNGEIFNRMLPNETVASIDGCISILGQDYIISRTFTRAAKSKNAVRDAKQEVHFYRVADNGDRIELSDSDTENLEGASTTETNKIIRETIGKEDDFNLIISANSKDLEDLISLTTTERGRMLNRWVGLSIIDDKESEAKKIWSSMKSRRLCNVMNTEDLKKDIEENEKSIKENETAISESESKVKKFEESIASREETIRVLLSGQRKVDDEVSKLDRETLLRAKKDITDKIERVQSSIDKCNTELSDYKEEKTFNEDEYKKVEEEFITLSAEKKTIKSDHERAKKEKETLENGEICPTCKRKLDNVDNTQAIKEKSDEIKRIVARANEIHFNLMPAVEAKKSELEKVREYIKSKNALELKKSGFVVELGNCKLNLVNTENSIRKLDEYSEAITINNEITTKVNVESENLKVDKRLLESEKNLISDCNNSIKNAKKKIDEDKVNIEKIAEELKVEKNWLTYLELVGKNGICKIVLRNTMPIINRKLNDLLDGLCDFKVEISVNEKDDVEFWLVRDGVYAKLSSASGMERTAAALALRVVLGNMSNLSRPPFIVLDEILGQVAEANYDNFRELYERISKFYDFILHIAHANLDWNTQDVLVTKENGISRVELITN